MVIPPGTTVAACVPYGGGSNNRRKKEEWILAEVSQFETRTQRYIVKDKFPDLNADQSLWSVSKEKVLVFPSEGSYEEGEIVLALWFIAEEMDWSSMLYEAEVIIVPQEKQKPLMIRYRGENTLFEIDSNKVVKYDPFASGDANSSPTKLINVNNLPCLNAKILINGGKPTHASTTTKRRRAHSDVSETSSEEDVNKRLPYLSNQTAHHQHSPMHHHQQSSTGVAVKRIKLSPQAYHHHPSSSTPDVIIDNNHIFHGQIFTSLLKLNVDKAKCCSVLDKKRFHAHQLSSRRASN